MKERICTTSPTTPPAPPSPNLKTPEAAALNLLTTKQAADYLGVKDTTLEQWRWNGRGPRFVKLGRSCRYRRKPDLEDFVEARVFSSTTEAQAAV